MGVKLRVSVTGGGGLEHAVSRHTQIAASSRSQLLVTEIVENLIDGRRDLADLEVSHLVEEWTEEVVRVSGVLVDRRVPVEVDGQAPFVVLMLQDVSCSLETLPPDSLRNVAECVHRHAPEWTEAFLVRRIERSDRGKPVNDETVTDGQFLEFFEDLPLHAASLAVGSAVTWTTVTKAFGDERSGTIVEIDEEDDSFFVEDASSDEESWQIVSVRDAHGNRV